eukprot:525358_1
MMSNVLNSVYAIQFFDIFLLHSNSSVSNSFPSTFCIYLVFYRDIQNHFLTMSLKHERYSQWNTLQSLLSTSFSQPFMIKNDEFMVALNQSNYSNGNGIYKFNTHKNVW